MLVEFVWLHNVKKRIKAETNEVQSKCFLTDSASLAPPKQPSLTGTTHRQAQLHAMTQFEHSHAWTLPRLTGLFYPRSNSRTWTNTGKLVYRPVRRCEADVDSALPVPLRSAASRAPSTHPSTGPQLPAQPAEHSPTCTQINTGINICVIIHSFHLASEPVNKLSFEDDLVLLQQKPSSFEYLGREAIHSWRKSFSLLQTLVLYLDSVKQPAVRVAYASKSISKRDVRFQFVRNSLWDSGLFDRRPAFAL